MFDCVCGVSCVIYFICVYVVCGVVCVMFLMWVCVVWYIVYDVSDVCVVQCV